MMEELTNSVTDDTLSVGAETQDLSPFSGLVEIHIYLNTLETLCYINIYEMN